jgi:AcrR family transcriptional regulator
MRARQKRERESRRDSIIEATEQLLKEKTFESITIDDIAVKSDFAKASIYQYFKNKDELMSEVFSKALEMECRMIEDQCLSQADPVQAIGNYIKLEFEFTRLHPWGPGVRATIHYKDFHAESRLIALHNRKKKLIADIIQRGLTQGTFMVFDLDAFTDVILSVSSGFAEQFLSTHRSTDLQSPPIEILISIITKGITKEER